MQYRQGDVLIETVKQVPTRLPEVPKEGGRVVLAHGEATGHSHSLGAGTLLADPSGDRFLILEADGSLTHQEHDAIDLPAGNYKVRRQVEYSPQAIRNVAD